PLPAVRATLAERDADRLAHAITALPAADTATARAAFTSYGSCSVLEPLEDLAALGLLDATP
ncbi:hypothetical protein K388_07305, partial [Streptomyces sp. KhCrAH-43]